MKIQTVLCRFDFIAKAPSATVVVTQRLIRWVRLYLKARKDAEQFEATMRDVQRSAELSPDAMVWLEDEARRAGNLFSRADIEKMTDPTVPVCQTCGGSNTVAVQLVPGWAIMCIDCHAAHATNWEPKR